MDTANSVTVMDEACFFRSLKPSVCAEPRLCWACRIDTFNVHSSTLLLTTRQSQGSTEKISRSTQPQTEKQNSRYFLPTTQTEYLLKFTADFLEVCVLPLKITPVLSIVVCVTLLEVTSKLAAVCLPHSESRQCPLGVCVTSESYDTFAGGVCAFTRHTNGAGLVSVMTDDSKVKSIQQVAVEDCYEQRHREGDGFGVPGRAQNVSTMWPQNTNGSLSSHGHQYPG